jgi:geranylgeranyl transferase type-1 subunit beta
MFSPRRYDSKYFRRSLSLLPEFVVDLDTSRMTLVFFGLSGLDIIDALSEEVKENDRKDWIEWIYAQQIPPPNSEPESQSAPGTSKNGKYS